MIDPWTRSLCVLGVIAGLAGCAPTASEVSPGAIAGAPVGKGDELAGFLAGAGPGASAALDLSGEPAPVVVSVEREYHAASGRVCRRLALLAPGGQPEARIACRDALGAWRLLPNLENQALRAVAGAELPVTRP